MPGTDPDFRLVVLHVDSMSTQSVCAKFFAMPINRLTTPSNCHNRLVIKLLLYGSKLLQFNRESDMFV